jgi:hypothetical protein
MRGITLAIVAAAVAALAGPAAAVPTAAAATAQAPRPVAIPFDPPVGQRLVYRLQRQYEPGDQDATTRMFALEFVRDADGYLMTVTPAAADGSPPALPNVPSPLVRQTFRVAPDGRIVEMLGEEAYWRALEELLQADVRADPGDADAEGALWAMRESRALPTDARMHVLADNVWQILAYAGVTVEPGRIVEERGPEVTLAGEIERIERTSVEALSDERISILLISTAPIDQLSAAVGQVVERFGRTPEGFGGRMVGSEARHSFDIDRRTGLASAYRSVMTITTEEGGRRSDLVSTMSIEQVEEPVRQR